MEPFVGARAAVRLLSSAMTGRIVPHGRAKPASQRRGKGFHGLKLGPTEGSSGACILLQTGISHFTLPPIQNLLDVTAWLI